MSEPSRGATGPLLIICSLSGLLIGACSDSTGSGSDCVVQSVTVSGLPDTLAALQQVQLTATIQPASCASEPVTWTATTGLDVSGSGQVMGTQLGGPRTVTATAGGVDGTAATVVTVAPIIQDSRWALAWTSSSDSADYAVSPAYSYSTGGAIRSTRSAVGTYAVRFPGLASASGQRQSVHVSAYGPSAPRRCRVDSWTNEGSDFVAHVRCHDFDGDLADSRFDIAVVPAGALSGRNGFVVTPASDTEPIDAKLAHNSSGGMVEVERTALGAYQVVFAGLLREQAGDPETVHVTAYGPGSGWCKVDGWSTASSGRADLGIDVVCYSATGSPADAQFSVLVLAEERPNRRLGYVWANMASSAAYTPSAPFNYNSAGGPNTAARIGAGDYDVSWPGLDRGAGSSPETNLVTAYGSATAVYCQVGYWAAPDAVKVLCYDPQENPVNSQFTAIWIE